MPETNFDPAAAIHKLRESGENSFSNAKHFSELASQYLDAARECQANLKETSALSYNVARELAVSAPHLDEAIEASTLAIAYGAVEDMSDKRVLLFFELMARQGVENPPSRNQLRERLYHCAKTLRRHSLWRSLPE